MSYNSVVKGISHIHYVCDQDIDPLSCITVIAVARAIRHIRPSRGIRHRHKYVKDSVIGYTYGKGEGTGHLVHVTHVYAI